MASISQLRSSWPTRLHALHWTETYGRLVFRDGFGIGRRWRPWLGCCAPPRCGDPRRMGGNPVESDLGPVVGDLG